MTQEQTLLALLETHGDAMVLAAPAAAPAQQTQHFPSTDELTALIQSRVE